MTLTIWISSFIPKDIANYTVSIPGSSRTAIPGPLPTSDCFLTDQRSFSADPAAACRMRTLISVDPASMTLTGERHHTDPTLECDCEDGEVECDRAASKERLKVLNFASAEGRCSFTLNGAASNPCVAGSPWIEWSIGMQVSRQGQATTVEILAGSVVEPFPAFEMYASLGAAAKPLFKRPPNAGATPWNLYGGPDQPVSGRVTFA